MILVPAGSFSMGTVDGYPDEKPARRVSVQAFFLDRWEVTNDRFAMFLNAWGRDADERGRKMIEDIPSGLRRSGGRWEAVPGAGAQPVAVATWFGAAQYARYYRRRLPTEAEWEYACRAGNPGKWCGGDDEGTLGEYAWYEANSAQAAHPVGGKRPNGYGFQDMHGNVWEWCADWYDAGYYRTGPARDPAGPLAGTRRVLRGGSWASTPEACRSAGRMGQKPGASHLLAGEEIDGFGFRCAASVAWSRSVPHRAIR